MENRIFEEPQRTALLRFEGSEFGGAEVRCRLNVPMQMFFDFQHVQDSEDAGEVEAAFQRFGDDVLIDWNVQEGGAPIPATGEGFKRVSPAFAAIIMQEWVQAVAEVPAPLGEPSPSGSTSGVESVPTEA